MSKTRTMRFRLISAALFLSLACNSWAEPYPKSPSGVSSQATAGYPADLIKAFDNPTPKGLTEAFLKSYPQATDRIPALFQLLGYQTWPGWTGPAPLASWAIEFLDSQDEAILKSCIVGVIAGPDPRRARGATLYWFSGKGKTWALKDSQTKALTILENGPDEEERLAAIAAMGKWPQLDGSELAQYLKLAFHDPVDRVREEGYRLARRLKQSDFEPELLQIASAKTSQYREVAKFSPGEQPDRSVGYISTLQDWQWATLTLAYRKSGHLKELLGTLPASPTKDLALALAGLPEKLNAKHFDSNSGFEEFVVEAVVRCRGSHGLDLAAHNLSTPGLIKIIKMLKKNHAPGLAMFKRSDRDNFFAGDDYTAWVKKHAKAYIQTIKPKP